MKYLSLLLPALALAALPARGQVVITAADMFTQPGEYFKAYSNEAETNFLSPTPYAVGSTLAGSPGGNQFWDFSAGPTDVIYQFDYVALADVDAEIASSFPLAKVAEAKKDLSSGNTEYLFFEQVPGLGRRVYGSYMPNLLFDPSNVFMPPILDFPDQIEFGDEWTTTTTWVNTVGGIDPTDPEEGGFSIAAQITHTATLKADAWGTAILPDELGGFGQALRINESMTIDVAVDDGNGAFQHVETDYARTYYWFMPGRGMVAALGSTHTATPTPENFSTATQFWRMFETNKKPASSGGGCVDPSPVQDLKIRFNGGQVLLSWTKASCANQYRLEYSTNVFDPASWTALGTNLTNQFFVLDNVSLDQQRFYRVVSLK